MLILDIDDKAVGSLIVLIQRIDFPGTRIIILNALISLFSQNIAVRPIRRKDEGSVLAFYAHLA